MAKMQPSERASVADYLERAANAIAGASGEGHPDVAAYYRARINAALTALPGAGRRVVARAATTVQKPSEALARLVGPHVLALVGAMHRARLSEIVEAATPETPQMKAEALKALQAIEKNLGAASLVSPAQTLTNEVLKITKEFEKLGNEYTATLQYFLGGDFQLLVDTAQTLRAEHTKARHNEPALKAAIEKALTGIAPIIEKLGGKPAQKQTAKPAAPKTPRAGEQEFDFGD